MIVFAFVTMARSNVQVMSRRLTISQRANIQNDLLSYLEMYWYLLEAASIAALANPHSRARTRSPGASRQPTLAATSAYTSQTTLSAAMTAAGGSASDLPIRVPGSAAAVKYRREQAKPNFHVGLHYEAIAREYAMIRNCNVLIGEDKHRAYKKAIYYTNHQNPERDLLARESFQQPIRLFLLDGYRHSETSIASQVQRIEQH